MSDTLFTDSGEYKSTYLETRRRVIELNKKIINIEAIILQYQDKASNIIRSIDKIQSDPIFQKYIVLASELEKIEPDFRKKIKNQSVIQLDPAPGLSLEQIQEELENYEKVRKPGDVVLANRVVELTRLAKKKYLFDMKVKIRKKKNDAFNILLEKRQNLLFEIGKYNTKKLKDKLDKLTVSLSRSHALMDLARSTDTNLKLSIAQEKKQLRFTLHNYKMARRDEIRRRNSIKKVISARQIKYLVHFTRLENVVNIFRHGILSRDECEKLNLESMCSDQHRFDDLTTRICLSISFPNYKMLFNKTNGMTSPEYCLIFINPRVLYINHCLFSQGNAASKSFRDAAVVDGWNGFALEKMFHNHNNKRSLSGIPSCFPTDPQAEVLLKGLIDSQEILAIVVRPSILEDNLSSEFEWTPEIMSKVHYNSDFFKYRSDWNHW